MADSKNKEYYDLLFGAFTDETLEQQLTQLRALLGTASSYWLDSDEGEQFQIPGPAGLQGTAGTPGADGARGTDGVVGRDGQDGEDAWPAQVLNPVAEDEGSVLPYSRHWNFTGSGVVVTYVNGKINIAISSGGGFSVTSNTEAFVFGHEQDTVVNTIADLNVTNANFRAFSWLPIDHSNASLDDFKLNGVDFNIENIVDNTSFDIRAVAANNASGNYRMTYTVLYA